MHKILYLLWRDIFPTRYLRLVFYRIQKVKNQINTKKMVIFKFSDYLIHLAFLAETLLLLRFF